MRVRIRGVLVMTAVLAAFSACGGVTEVGMMPTGCVPALSPTSQNASAGGGSFALSVTVAQSCEWRAAADAAWVTTEASGSGSGSAAYTVAPNTTATRREARMSVGEGSILITQSPADCAYSVTPSPVSLDASGGALELDVVTNPGCTWTASGTEGWISGLPQTKSGPGTLSVTVAANPGNSPRTGSIQVEGQTIAVSQDGISCSFDVSTREETVTTDGGTFQVRITVADSGCPWSARAGAEWLRVQPESGSGPATVTVVAAANDRNEPRHARVEVAGRSITVSQQAECGVTLSTGSISVPASGGSTEIGVTTAPGCGWRTQGNPDWINVDQQAGAGAGRVVVRVAANPALTPRVATFQIADGRVTVTQSGVACDIRLSPTARAFNSGGGEGDFRVNAPAGCAWTATPLDGWIRIVSGSGTGDGGVTFVVETNPLPAERRGGVRVGDQTFTITQAAAPAPCTFDVTYIDMSEEGRPERPWTGSVTVAGEGAELRVNVDAGIECEWTSAARPDAWISGLGTAEVGSGSITLQVSCNDLDDRGADVIVAGQRARLQQRFTDGECSVELARQQRRSHPQQ
jgi:hypothetical protein